MGNWLCGLMIGVCKLCRVAELITDSTFKVMRTENVNLSPNLEAKSTLEDNSFTTH